MARTSTPPVQLAERPPRKVIVLGAGLAGLACAGALAEEGHTVVVFDKGRAPGGRASTRREADGRIFDHGAQFFTARGSWLTSRVAAWAREGVIGAWAPRFAAPENDAGGNGETWWVGTPTMGSVAAHLARGLDVRCGSRVTALGPRASGWVVSVAGAREHEGASVDHEGDALVVALPAPQAAALLGPSSSLTEALGAYELEPCWAVMVALAWPGGQPPPVDLLRSERGPLAWAAREGSKPGRVLPPGEDLWTVHASAAWSHAHLEDPAENVTDVLVAALLTQLAELGRLGAEVRLATAHRWRFARPRIAPRKRCLHDRGAALTLCGDWLESPRVEGALISGRAAAEAVLGDFASVA